MELLNEYIEAYLSTLRYLDEVIAEPADEYGLSFEQYLIMNQVAKEDGITLSAIVNNCRVTRAAISRQIKTLLQRQYVYQEPDHGDRRRMLLQLTEWGMEIEAIVTERVQLRFDGWVEVFGEVKAREILTFIQAFDAKVVSRSKTYAHQYE